MKVAFFTDCYLDLTGGIKSSIDAQKKALEDDGYEVYIFSSGFPRSEKEIKALAREKIFVVPSCRLFFRGLTPVSRRPKLVEDWVLKVHPEIKNFDIYYIHYEAGCSIAGLRLGRKLGIPTIQVMHGREDMGETNIIPRGFRTIVALALNLFHSWYIPHRTKVHCDEFYADTLARAKMWSLMVNHANFADIVLTPSEHFREKLIRYGVTKPIKVVANGYPDDKLPDNPTLKQLSPGEELKIVWHSRVSAEKRMMPFLRAMTKARGKFRLDVYGGGGDYYRAQRFARRHHLNVIFHGNVDFATAQKAIDDAHLDVLVSYNFDTFGMTLIEAEAHGTPVFFCDPDMKEIVPEGSYIISKNENPNEMAKALNYIFKHPSKIAEMSRTMLDHRKEVLISKRIKTLEKIFDSATANSSSR